MTRLSLIFFSTAVACVIGLAPQKETGAAFQAAPVKTRSLAAVGAKSGQTRPLPRDNCAPLEKMGCTSPIPGSSGPRG